VPAALSDPRPTLNNPEVNGIWQDLDTARAAAATGTLAAGTAYGQQWSIKLNFGTRGDCYVLITSYVDDSVNAQPAVSPVCAPVSTPTGPTTIAVMPLGTPAAGDLGTGYAVALGAGTSRVIAELTGGRTLQATPVEVAGRRYAAFFVPEPARLTGLIAVDGTHRAVVLTQDPPQNGYAQVSG
jgi:hypothetical protein